MKPVLQKLFLALLLLPVAAMSQWTQLGQTVNSPYDSSSGIDNSRFGNSVALSAGGTIMAVGAPLFAANPISGTSFVQVFRLVSGEWVQIGDDIEGAEKLDSAEYRPEAGASVGISADGNIVAVGESYWYGMDGENIISGGRVRLFQNIDDQWVQIGDDIYDEDLEFGKKLSLSSDGNVVAVHSPLTSALFAGKVKVYQNTLGNWTQMGATFQGTGFFQSLGSGLSLSHNGSKLVLTSFVLNPITFEGSGEIGYYEYNSNDNEWNQVSTIQDQNSSIAFTSVSLSGDGTRLVTGASGYSHSDTVPTSGLVKFFEFSEEEIWVETGSFEPQPVIMNTAFGSNVSISADGNVAAVGSGSVGEIVSVYKRIGSEWTLVEENFATEGTISLALSSDGSVLAMGKPNTNGSYGSVITYKNCLLATVEAPEAEVTQEFNTGETLADLTVSAEGTLTWYADEDLIEVLDENTPLADETTYYVTQTNIIGCESEAAAVTVAFLSLTDFTQNHFTYYPNPVKDILNFTLENDSIQEVQLYDLSGKLVFEQKSAQTIDAVNLSMLTKGMYVAKIQTERNVHTFKLIKE